MGMEYMSVGWREVRGRENERGLPQPGFTFPVSSEKSLVSMARPHILSWFYFTSCSSSEFRIKMF